MLYCYFYTMLRKAQEQAERQNRFSIQYTNAILLSGTPHVSLVQELVAKVLAGERIDARFAMLYAFVDQNLQNGVPVDWLMGEHLFKIYRLLASMDTEA